MYRYPEMRLSLRHKTAILFICITAVLSGCIIFAANNHLRKAIDQEYQTRASDVAHTAAAIVDEKHAETVISAVQEILAGIEEPVEEPADEPAEPVKPAEPDQQEDPVQPAEPVNPAEPDQQEDPVQPVKPDEAETPDAAEDADEAATEVAAEEETIEEGDKIPYPDGHTVPDMQIHQGFIPPFGAAP